MCHLVGDDEWAAGKAMRSDHVLRVFHEYIISSVELGQSLQLDLLKN